MDWKENLRTYLDKSGKSDIEIHSFTNISTSTLSKIRNKKVEKLQASQFHLLRLYFKEEHTRFLDEIFGVANVDIDKKQEQEISRTALGKILNKNYGLETLTITDLAELSEIQRDRLKYLNFKDDSSISVVELTKIELALKLTHGFLFNKLYKKLTLNSESKAKKLMEEQRKYNAKSNERRKGN